MEQLVLTELDNMESVELYIKDGAYVNFTYIQNTHVIQKKIIHQTMIYNLNT